MKPAMLAALLVLSASGLLASSRTETPNPADYNVIVHVVSSHIVTGHESQSQDLTVVIDGKRLELEGGAPHLDLLRLGDYKAKLLKKDESRAYEYQWVFEFLFPDGKTRDYLVIGEGE